MGVVYKQIPNMPLAIALAGPEEFEIVQAGESKRSSISQLTALVRSQVAGSPSPPTGPAGGDLTGFYPNPVIKPSIVNGQVLTTLAGVATWATPAPAGGTVTSVSVISANGLAGTVATPTTTPAITLSTTITGLLKGNGTAISAAVPGTDYIAIGGSAGGDLSGTFPNPTVNPEAIDDRVAALLVAGSNITLSYNDPANTLTIASTASGSGSVTSVSVVSANGLAGTVATPTAAAAITLSTTVTGMLKGNGTAISAATAGTDYMTPGNVSAAYQPLDTGLTALSSIGTGIVTNTAADTFTGRTITGTAARLSVSNGSGVGGNPTLDIDSAYVGQASITTVGTISTGTWQGSVIAGQYGGTGVANTGKTITLGGNLVTSGAFASTFTMTGTTTVTFPTSGTLATTAQLTAGTVTSVSVVSANGLAGTVATATVTPAITLSTTITGMLKGNGTAISAGVAGTDYVSPGGLTTALGSYLPLAGGIMTGTITSTQGVTAANRPFFDGTETWNNAAVNFTGIKLNITNTASLDPSYPLQLQVNSANIFTVDKYGNLVGNSGIYNGDLVQSLGRHQANNTTAIPAGGTAGNGHLFSTTANFGTNFGSAAPTVSMARGSLYLRSDGLPYVNRDGATNWGALTALSVGTTAPTAPNDGELWFYSDAVAGGGSLYLRYNDGTGASQWVPASPAASGTTIPPGSIMDFAGVTAPAGWLLCQGQSLSTTTYAALFAVIGYTYGGSGGNFNAPDLGGRVTAGKETTATRLTTGGAGIDGATLGASGGVQTHVLTQAQLASHVHGYTDPGHAHNVAPPGTVSLSLTNGDTFWANLPGGTGGNNIYYFSSVDARLVGITITAAGSDAAHQNTQPTMIMNKIIKT